MIRALQMTDLPWVRALYADFLAEDRHLTQDEVAGYGVMHGALAAAF